MGGTTLVVSLPQSPLFAKYLLRRESESLKILPMLLTHRKCKFVRLISETGSVPLR